ncbi:unnamed protein product [Penicillium manginii]
MYSTAVMAMLVAAFAANPTLALPEAQGWKHHSRDAGGRFDVYLSTDMVSVGASSPHYAYQQAYRFCERSACVPGNLYTYDVTIYTSGGTYAQQEQGKLTVKADGDYDNAWGEWDWKERNGLIEAIAAAGDAAAKVDKVQTQSGPGLSGPECEKNPAACKGPKFKTTNYWSCPSQVKAVMLDSEGKEKGQITVSLSLDAPKFDLGALLCNDVKPLVDKALGTVENAYGEAIGKIGDIACNIFG